MSTTVRAAAASDPLSTKDTLEHAWRYFALHAGQRMSLFNYFLILFAVVAAGLAGCIRADGLLRLAGAALGLALAAVSLAFWKLEQRSAFLVKHAESALRDLEASIILDGARLFQHEPGATQAVQARGLGLTGVWTYGRSFRFVFILSGVVGLVGAATSIGLFFMSFE